MQFRSTMIELAAASVAATGLLALARARRRRRGDHRVFIVEYHDVSGDGAEPEMVVRASRLRSHIRELKRHFQVSSLGEATRVLNCRAAASDLRVRAHNSFSRGHSTGIRFLPERGAAEGLVNRLRTPVEHVLFRQVTAPHTRCNRDASTLPSSSRFGPETPDGGVVAGMGRSVSGARIRVVRASGPPSRERRYRVETVKALKRTTAEIVAATAVSTGLLALARTLRRRRGGHRVFIVEYHDLTDGGGEPEMVGHASRLRSHIRELKRHFQVAPLGRQPGLWKAPGRRRGDLGAASTRRAHAEFSWRENARRMVAAYEAAIVRHDEAKPCTAR